MTNAELIEKLENDLKSYEEPAYYQDEEYYIQCRAKADYIRELLDYLRN